MQTTLAELLLRRKELNAKVGQLAMIKDKDLFEVKGTRQKLTDDLDNVIAQVPLLDAAQVTHEYDWYAKQLRIVDGVIQRTNWATIVGVDGAALGDYPGVPARTPRGPKDKAAA